MKYLNQAITYIKKDGKIYEIIEKEIDLSSLDNDIIEIKNNRDSEYLKMLEVQEIKDKLNN